MTTDHQPDLIQCAPYFPVHHLRASTDYYRDVLGFSLDYSGGDPPRFAILSRDGLSLMLRLVSPDDGIVPNEAQGGTWDVFFWVRDVESLWREFRSKGAHFAYDVTYQPEYNMDEFAVRDPDGHVLGFGQSRN